MTADDAWAYTTGGDWQHCPLCCSYYTGLHQCPTDPSTVNHILTALHHVDAKIDQILDRLEAQYPTRIRLARETATKEGDADG